MPNPGMSFVGNQSSHQPIQWNIIFYIFGNGGHWSLRYYADIGTGESDVTWQALLGLGYRFGWGDLFADYRHLDYEFGDTALLGDVASAFSGPSIGATFRFGSSK